MLDDQPLRRQQLGREGVGLNLPRVEASAGVEECPHQNLFVVEAGLMAECGVAEFVRCREPLTGSWRCVVTITPWPCGSLMYAPSRFVSGRNITGMSRSTSMPNTSIRPSPLLGAGLSVVLLVQPVRLVTRRSGFHRVVATAHPSFFCFLARRKSANRPSSSRSSGESSETLPGQVLDVCAESNRPRFLAGEVADRALVEAGQFLQLQGIHLALPGLHERQGGPRDAQEGRDLILREAEVFPRFPEPLAQRLPIIILVVGLRLVPCSFAHLWLASLGPESS